MSYGCTQTINEVARIFAHACEQTLSQATHSKITIAPTIQKVPAVFLKPDIGCFVQFFGDYSGLFIMNLSGAVALELYRKSMLFMGLPEEELAREHTSDEVVDSIGELVNQIMGKARSMIKERFGLIASNHQPKGITIASVITMSIATPLTRPQCRRISLRSADNHSFHVELSMEDTEFIEAFQNEAADGGINPKNSVNLDPDSELDDINRLIDNL
ncbi:MAG: DUF3334 family protein [Deltaproteobacteria bacterium]|nr:DUF3334 family protein [Deltaproteobacteria bacterium]